MKAFLCHSSKDKEYLLVVARRLGRAKVVFDQMSFEPGIDFRDSISKGLDDSKLFVFFASRDSLSSLWCTYELDEANHRLIHKRIEGALCIIIDRDVSLDQLPRWLRRAKVLIQPSPVQSCREIQNALLSATGPDLRHPFVGREKNLEEFSRALIDISAQHSSQVFCVSGLEGVGRRTLISRAVQDNLSLRLGPFFNVDPTRTVEDIYLWTLDETSDLGSRANMAAEMESFRRLGSDEQTTEVCNRVKMITDNNFLPCLIDLGGLLDENGVYLSDYKAIIQKIAAKENGCLAVIHRRSPSLMDLSVQLPILSLSVYPLENESMRLLLTQLLKPLDTKASREQIDELVEYLDGYPPAAYFSVAFVARYGLGTLLADKSMLEDFKARVFARFLDTLQFSDEEWFILKYLAGEQGVPLGAISVASGMDQGATVPILRKLIDFSLVIPVDDNFVISGPVRTAIQRAKGFISPDRYKSITEALTKTFWEDENMSPSIEVVDATLHAVARSGETDFHPYSDLVRPSTLHRLAKESYDRKEWKPALAYAERTLAIDPNRSEVQIIRLKALVRLEHWSGAEKVLGEIEARGDKKQFYLKGFMLWKQRRYDDALKSFESALDSGDRANSVFRDYAECLYRLSRFNDALEKISVALERDPGNIYTLDLIVRICIDSNNAAKAKDYLERLERADKEQRFIHHRKSRYYSLVRHLDLALQEAERACDAGAALFEAFAQKADVLIELNRIDDAKKMLEEIEERFGRSRKDIQSGLRCKLLLRMNKWREAHSAWQGIVDRDSMVHKALYRQIMLKKSQDETLSLEERRFAREQAQTVQALIIPSAFIEPDDIEL